jgi:hypothetical protein
MFCEPQHFQIYYRLSNNLTTRNFLQEVSNKLLRKLIYELKLLICIREVLVLISADTMAVPCEKIPG